MASRKTSLTRIAQWLLAAVVIGFAARAIARQWQDVAPALENLRVKWPWILASGIIVIATYLLLVEAWRSTLRAWGDRLPYGTAARIWFVSNLGKYLPGKVWQIAAMGAMAQQRGVSAAAAIGSALVVNLVSIIAGVAVIVATAGRRVALAVGPQTSTVDERTSVLIALGLVVLGIGALVLTPVLVPRLARLAGRVTGKSVGVPTVPARAIWIAAASTAASWIFYGVAFALFANGITPRAAGNAASYIAVYTGSYLAGYLALFVPGGVGVREAAIVLAMPRFELASTADATIIALTSRLWLTVLEILPGVLLMQRTDRSRQQLPQDNQDVD